MPDQSPQRSPAILMQMLFVQGPGGNHMHSQPGTCTQRLDTARLGAEASALQCTRQLEKPATMMRRWALLLQKALCFQSHAHAANSLQTASSSGRTDI